jgi:hypothetical protein
VVNWASVAFDYLEVMRSTLGESNKLFHIPAMGRMPHGSPSLGHVAPYNWSTKTATSHNMIRP